MNTINMLKICMMIEEEMHKLYGQGMPLMNQGALPIKEVLVKQRKQRVHNECVELITGHPVKTIEQIKKELDENDWF